MQCGWLYWFLTVNQKLTNRGWTIYTDRVLWNMSYVVLYEPPTPLADGEHSPHLVGWGFRDVQAWGLINMHSNNVSSTQSTHFQYITYGHTHTRLLKQLSAIACSQLLHAHVGSLIIGPLFALHMAFTCVNVHPQDSKLHIHMYYLLACVSQCTK